MRDVVTLVLSGGGGERLGVLTTERAVSAIPFGGKYRIIDFVLSNCCHSGLDQVGVLTQHAPTSLHDHIGAGRPWDLDRRDHGVTVLQPYLTRGSGGWYRGTADAIAQNWDEVESLGRERVLVLSGDHVYRMDYGALFLAHEQRGASATLAVTPVPADETHRFGMVTVEGGRVTRLVEKPQRSETPLASMGIYVFELRALRERLGGGAVDLVADVILPMLAEGRPVGAYPFEGYWQDVGTTTSYYRANLELLATEPGLALHDRRWPILTRDEERPPVMVLDGAVLEDSLVANGARVAGTIRRSLLSAGVVVESGAVVEDSIVMQDVVIEGGAHIRRAILDKYVRVGAGASLGGESVPGAGPQWLGGLTMVGKDAQIAPGARVGAGSIVGVGALPGDIAGGVLRAGGTIANRTWYEAGA